MNREASGSGLARLLGTVRLDSLLGVVSSLNEGLIVLDPELAIVAMNPAAEVLLGRPSADLIGMPVCRLFGERACPQDALEQTLRAGAPIVDYQTTVDLGSGRQGHVLLRSAPLLGRGGEELGLALLLGDVTEVTDLRKLMTGRDRFGRLIGRDPRMRELYALIADVAGSEATVLIRGESGTGKELVARALHECRAARLRALRGGQLLGAQRAAAGERTVRPCARRLHRRGQRTTRALCRSERRHHLPGRDRRRQPRGAGQAAARAAGAGRRTGGGQPPGAGGCAHRVGHAPRSRGAGRRRTRARRLLLPHPGGDAAGAAVAGAARGHPAAGRAHPGALRPARRAGGGAGDRRERAGAADGPHLAGQRPGAGERAGPRAGAGPGRRTDVGAPAAGTARSRARGRARSASRRPIRSRSAICWPASCAPRGGTAPGRPGSWAWTAARCGARSGSTGCSPTTPERRSSDGVGREEVRGDRLRRSAGRGRGRGRGPDLVFDAAVTRIQESPGQRTGAGRRHGRGRRLFVRRRTACRLRRVWRRSSACARPPPSGDSAWRPRRTGSRRTGATGGGGWGRRTIWRRCWPASGWPATRRCGKADDVAGRIRLAVRPGLLRLAGARSGGRTSAGRRSPGRRRRGARRRRGPLRALAPAMAGRRGARGRRGAGTAARTVWRRDGRRRPIRSN